jgi:hypothetical protein
VSLAITPSCDVGGYGSSPRSIFLSTSPLARSDMNEYRGTRAMELLPGCDRCLGRWWSPHIGLAQRRQRACLRWMSGSVPHESHYAAAEGERACIPTMPHMPGWPGRRVHALCVNEPDSYMHSCPRRRWWGMSGHDSCSERAHAERLVTSRAPRVSGDVCRPMSAFTRSGDVRRSVCVTGEPRCVCCCVSLARVYPRSIFGSQSWRAGCGSACIRSHL